MGRFRDQLGWLHEFKKKIVTPNYEYPIFWKLENNLIYVELGKVLHYSIFLCS